MSRKPPQKCIDCVLSVIHKPGHGIDNKPDCYEHRICARKRSYYRNHAANKERQNKQHRYLKYKGDHCAICVKRFGRKRSEMRGGGSKDRVRFDVWQHTPSRAGQIF